MNKVNALKKFFVLRDDCEFDLGLYNNSTIKNNKYCPSTADYLTCFPSRPVNYTFTTPCPYKEGLTILEPNNNVTRICLPNGTWAPTNYIDCIKNVINSVTSGGCHVRNRTNKKHNVTDKYIECDEEISHDNAIYKVMIYANLIGFFITIISVSLAIFIFLSIRSLRCVRNMIHCNMLFTFVVKCTGHIGFYIFILSNETIWESNHVISLFTITFIFYFIILFVKILKFLCVVFNIILNYSLLCSFFWMMIEAVYLITVIVAAYSSNKIKLWWYLIIGWSKYLHYSIFLK
jgi:corticotropin releasing hormone receptor 2